MPPVRIAGDREQQILDATVAVLAEVGYDRLTMDAVASHAKASKATLYRRWDSKAALVIDSLCAQKGPMEAADTGSLCGDLLATFCGEGGLSDPPAMGAFTSVITAIGRDPEFAEAYRRDFIAPKQAIMHEIYLRAQDRGEVSADADLELLEPALAGIILSRMLLLGEPSSRELIARVIDNVIIPAATR